MITKIHKPHFGHNKVTLPAQIFLYFVQYIQQNLKFNQPVFEAPAFAILNWEANTGPIGIFTYNGLSSQTSSFTLTIITPPVRGHVAIQNRLSRYCNNWRQEEFSPPLQTTRSSRCRADMLKCHEPILQSFDWSNTAQLSHQYSTTDVIAARKHQERIWLAITGGTGRRIGLAYFLPTSLTWRVFVCVIMAVVDWLDIFRPTACNVSGRRAVTKTGLSTDVVLRLRGRD